MRARITRIGDAHAIRIPERLLGLSGLGEEVEVELEAQRHRIIIRRAGRPRRGWDAAFRSMAEHGEDVVLNPDVVGSGEWESEEWQW